MHTLNYSSLFQLTLRHSAYAVRAKVGVSGLYAPQTAEIFIAWFLPLGYEILIGDVFVEAEVVELATYRLSAEEKVVDVSGLLVVDFEYWPEGFLFAFALVGFGFRCKEINEILFVNVGM